MENPKEVLGLLLELQLDAIMLDINTTHLTKRILTNLDNDT